MKTMFSSALEPLLGHSLVANATSEQLQMISVGVCL